MILQEIRRLTRYASQHEADFARVVMGYSQQAGTNQRENKRKELYALTARDRVLDKILSKCYEDSLSGRITEERFGTMSRRYEAEQAELRAKIAPLKKEIAKHNRHNCTTDEFLDVVRKHTHMKELIREILHEFIDHIVVHNAENLKGERVQKIEIFYNCIGLFEAPRMDELPRTPIRLDTRKGVAVSYSPSKVAV